jgi:hypothetical protein
LYAGDITLVAVTRELLNFYAEEAEKQAPVALAYFEANENFGKVQKAFEAKKEKDRKQEDVDTFNEAVNSVNSAVNAYNAGNEKANKDRAANIDNWNKSADKFTMKHVPHGK